ncbi:MAG: ABC transporter substrate-binding protein [Nocardia sp.]|nr:ABC transporter substrate-binding protein [Nocardia sp.]
MTTRRAVLHAAALAPILTACAPNTVFGASSQLRIAVPWSGSELSAFRKVLTDTGTERGVAVLPLGDDIDTALVTRGRSAPDLIMLPEVGRIDALAGSVLRAFPDTLWQDGTGPRYPDVWRNLVWHRGALYAIPFKSAYKSLIWYDRQAFGGADPARWPLDQWRDRVAEVSARRPFALGGADGWVLADLFGNILHSRSRRAYRRLAVQGAVESGQERKWDSLPVRASMRRMAELCAPAGTFPGGIAGALTSQFPDSVRAVFEHRAAAAVMAPDFAEPIVRSCLRRSRRSPEVVGVMPFQAFAAGHRPPVIGAGDVLVATTSARRDVMPVVAALSAPGAVSGWIADYGGFLAPSTRTVTDHPPLLDPVAGQLRSWTDFDLADLLGTAGRRDGLWRALTDLLVTVGDGHPERIDSAVERAVRTLEDFDGGIR